MDLIQKIARIFCGCQREIISLPMSTEEIDNAHLRNLLRAWFPEANIYLSDKVYKLCCLSDIRYFLRQDKTNRLKFEKEFFDCDDFAYRLMGQFSIPGWSALALGFCWTDKHAVNILIGQDKKFYYVEPQQDTIQETLKAWQGSKVLLVVI